MKEYNQIYCNGLFLIKYISLEGIGNTPISLILILKVQAILILVTQMLKWQIKIEIILLI